MSMRPFGNDQRRSATSVAVMALTLALFLALLPQAAGAASSGYATIELRGSKSAYVDVVFNRPTTIPYATYAASSDHDVPPLTVRTRGSYAGYLVERLPDGKFVAGAVRVPVLDMEDTYYGPVMRSTIALNRRRAALPPGTYRIHLVTDGPSTLRFRVDGLDENASYRPKEPTPVSSSFRSPPTTAGEPVHHMTPMTVTEGTLVILASFLIADQSHASYLEHCVVRMVEPCQSRRDHSAMITVTPTLPWSLSRNTSIYKPGHFEPGEWQAQFTAASAGSIRRADMFLLTVDLVGIDGGADGGDGTEPDPDPSAEPDEGSDPSPRPHRSPSDQQGTNDGPRVDGLGVSAPEGAGGSSIRPAPHSSLASTGMNARLYVALALGLLVLGALMIVVARRRRHSGCPAG